MSDTEASDTEAEAPATGLALEYELDAAPEKVWRAISIPAFREKWLPAGRLADPDPVSTIPGEEIRYRMRDDAPPFLESVVTLQVRPGAGGGAILRILHAPAEARRAANDPGPWLMRAA